MNQHLIVGAGLNGMFTAYYLMLAGENVVLLDQGDVGKESSWAGGGILSPLHPWRYPVGVTAIASWSQKHYPDILSNLHAQTGIDPEFLRSGLLILDTSESTRAMQWAKENNQSINLLNEKDLRNNYGQIHTGFSTGMLMEHVGQVRNPSLVQALQRFLIAGGVTILKHEKCLQLVIERQQITGIITNKQKLTGDSVSLCTGAWIRDLLQGTSNLPSIEPVKGQMLLLQTPPNLINHIVLGESNYVIPRKDGLVLVGSTLEYVGFDKSTTTLAKQTLLHAAYSLIPKLREATFIKQWSGLRPGSKNGMPTICSHPEIDGLFINSGQYRNGVVMAPGSGKILADLILCKNTFTDNDAYKLASTVILDTV